METRENNQKWRFYSKNTPLRENFPNSFISVGHRLTFLPEFPADLSRYKEK